MASASFGSVPFLNSLMGGYEKRWVMSVYLYRSGQPPKLTGPEPVRPAQRPGTAMVPQGASWGLECPHVADFRRSSRGRDGAVEAIRALMVAKRTARGERTQTINQAQALVAARASSGIWEVTRKATLVLTGPDDFRARSPGTA